MSGVILLVGALGVGGKGLNLGIDFTSGRGSGRARAPATQQQVTSGATAAAERRTRPSRRSPGNRALGPNGFQISSKTLAPDKVNQVQSALQSKFGIINGGNQFDVSSVGPTFGKTIANAAVIAIIASLLVISVYVALRFEWKFAMPVLIALMHDLLITSGVYALTGRQVTVDTVAALLTILGYSLYDTIIVFDRVRENIPRMPRAAFSQIVNRSMSEVLTRSMATTSCTLMPMIALLLFGGGGVLGDFAFALLIGVASGAYSSIFIASPVLTHWKEREQVYRARRHRLIEDNGHVPAYAGAGADVEPAKKRPAPDRAADDPRPGDRVGRRVRADEARPRGRGASARASDLDADQADLATARDGGARPAHEGTEPRQQPAPRAPARSRPGDGTKPVWRPAAPEAATAPVEPAPDIAENEGVAPVQKPKPAKSQSRARRRHGRRR